MAIGEGNVHSHNHFTGKKGGPSNKRKRKSSREERRRNRGSHVNKYAHFASGNKFDPKDKTYRNLPVLGVSGEIVPAGTIVFWHERRYGLMEDLVIPESGIIYGKFKLVMVR